MGKILRQTESEMKQLPLLLGKVLGGIMAAIGLPAVVFIATRKANPSLSDILPYFLLGIAGIILFSVSSLALARRVSGNTGQTPAPKDKMGMSIIGWVVLLVLAAVFLCSHFS